jgi:hypothetical protein
MMRLISVNTGMLYLCHALPEAFQFDLGQLAFRSKWQIQPFFRNTSI